MYKVVITDTAVKSLKKIPKADARRFFQKIDQISQDPHAPLPYVKRLKSSSNFRFRFGDYRCIYSLEDNILTITVIDVAHRKDIYKEP